MTVTPVLTAVNASHLEDNRAHSNDMETSDTDGGINAKQEITRELLAD